MILRSVSSDCPAFCMFDPAGGGITDASALPLAAVQFQTLMMIGLLLLLEDPSHENIDWPDYSRCGYGTWDRSFERTRKRRELFRRDYRAKHRPQVADQRNRRGYKS